MKSNKGFSVITVLVLIALIAAVSGGIMTYFSGLRGASKQGKASEAIRQIKENLVATIDNDMAWYKTTNDLLNNGSLGCLRNPPTAPCAGMSGSFFALIDGDGTPIITTNPESGFDIAGSPCSTFVSGGGPIPCMYRYELKWQCLGGACSATTFPAGGGINASTPKVQIIGTLKVSSAYPNEKSVNTLAYNIDITRGSVDKTLAKFCTSINGTFDGKGSCASAMSNPQQFDCRTLGPHYYFAGFNASGTPACVQDVKTGNYCQDGSGVVGLTADGSIQCGVF